MHWSGGADNHTFAPAWHHQHSPQRAQHRPAPHCNRGAYGEPPVIEGVTPIADDRQQLRESKFSRHQEDTRLRPGGASAFERRPAVAVYDCALRRPNLTLQKCRRRPNVRPLAVTTHRIVLPLLASQGAVSIKLTVACCNLHDWT
jgi:hypothetical protein